MSSPWPVYRARQIKKRLGFLGRSLDCGKSEERLLSLITSDFERVRLGDADRYNIDKDIRGLLFDFH
jgi:hypothetical protein